MSPAPGGLTDREAAERLRASGPNAIVRRAGPSVWTQLFKQFASPLVWLLAGGCVLAAALGERADAAAILAIVLLNGAVGFAQERGAERAIDALRSLTSPRARVRRQGTSAQVPASDVVPGDLLILESGDIVAADARLLEAHRLSVNEAALTGESLPVDKDAAAAEPGRPLAERRDSVFMGTAIARGTGVAEVVATGMRTELGRIAHLLDTVEEGETPLQRRLADVGRVLLYVCLTIVAAVAVLGLLRARPPIDVLLSAVALAVAAVPEGLPVVVTIALAVGVRRMAARQALIRRLAAVETLGCATVICTDKTGTLTTGVMAVREIWSRDPDRLLRAAAACCDAELGRDSAGSGDPTELALLAAAARRGIYREDVERDAARLHTEPFDPATKRMSVRRADGVTYVKGALEVLLPDCTTGSEGADAAAARMAAGGLRVIAVASGASADRLDLHGLAGLADPPRPEAIDAVAAARAAGITTVMITGDHAVTARAIARELGILRAGDAEEDVVRARATPEDKLQVVRQWKARGAIVAMTGDGVNDAPALREAHIGIAMGRSGTEVTREASDIVLADDNFASIIAAVREGRGAYDNIRKTLVYLLGGNAAELTVMLAASIAGLPLPLLPIHLLWINIVTDGLPALALVTDPVAPDALRRPPRRTGEPLLGRLEWRVIAVTACVEAALTLAVFGVVLRTGTLTEARSAAFSTLVLSELFRAFAARSAVRIFWHVGALTNLRLVTVVTASAAAQALLHQLPAAQRAFGVEALSAERWALAVAAALGPVTALELWKLAGRGAGKATPQSNVVGKS